MKRFIRRAAISGLLVMLAFALIGPLRATAQPQLFDGPLNLTATPAGNDTYTATWEPPSLDAEQVTAYTLRLDDAVVGKVSIANGTTATEVDLKMADLAAGGTLTVSATIGQNRETTRSIGVKIAPSVQTPVTPGSDPTATTDSPPDESVAGTEDIFGGGIKLPKPAAGLKNNPTAFETYGLKAGYTKIYSDLKLSPLPTDAVKNLEMLPKIGQMNLTRTLWKTSVLMQASGLTFFAWAVSPTTYAALAQGVASLVDSFAKSGWSKLFVLAGAVALTIWSAFRLARERSGVYQAIAYGMFFLLIATIYMVSANTVASKVVQAPLTATQAVIVGVDQWEVPGETEESYNLSVKPTYQGDPLDQGMRRHLNQQWLATDYPAYCQINFGNVEWATHTFVPDNKALPTYTHLTFCEFLLKAQVEGNQKALDYLDGGMIGKGEVEKASPAVWDFFQGNQADSRVMYSVTSLISQFLLAPVTWGIGLMILFVVLLVSIDAVLMVIWLLAGLYPELRERIFRQAKSIARRIVLPALFTGLMLLALKLQDAVVAMLGPSGWFVASFVRSIGTVIVYVAMLWLVGVMLLRHAYEKVVELDDEQLGTLLGTLTASATNGDTSPAPPQPLAAPEPSPPSIQSMAVPLVLAGVTGGTSAVALGALQMVNTSNGGETAKPVPIPA